MSDDAPEPDELDLDAWPEARDAYRTARDLARRAVDEGSFKGEGAASRELARYKARLGLRGLDPAAEARIRAAIGWGEADGRGGAGRGGEAPRGGGRGRAGRGGQGGHARAGRSPASR